MSGHRCTIWKEMTFDASHQLPFLPANHKCARVHGHTYRVRVAVTGPVVQPVGWVMDLGFLKTYMEALVGLLDHRHLNDVDGLGNPTAENIAIWFAERMRLTLPLEVELASVEVQETPTSGVSLAFS